MSTDCILIASKKYNIYNLGILACRLDFCNWLNENRHLYRYVLFSDEAQFTRDGINNTRNSHVWAELNPHPTMETNFQHHCSINLWGCSARLADRFIHFSGMLDWCGLSAVCFYKKNCRSYLRMFLWRWDTVWCSSIMAHLLASTMQWWIWMCISLRDG
jgi:hypothetical protein